MAMPGKMSRSDSFRKRNGCASRLCKVVAWIACILALAAAVHVTSNKKPINGDITQPTSKLQTRHYSFPYQGCKLNPKKSKINYLHRLQPAAVWKSKKPTNPNSISIVTQLSLERLEMVGMQCSVWRDPIAAVVYIPLHNDRVINLNEGNSSTVGGMSLSAAKKIVDGFHEYAESLETGCALDLELVIEVFDKPNDPNASLYPFNALRNRAMLLAKTDAVLMLDADFVSSAGLASSYQDPSGFNALMKQLASKVAIVLPAFSIGDAKPYMLTYTRDGVIEHYRKLAMAAALLGKNFVVKCFKDNILLAAVSYWPPAHMPTDYDRWTTATSTYEVEYKKFYEPYVLVHRKYFPWYDERFRGYGNDKVQNLAQLASFGIKMEVHPTEYVIHMPHRLSVTVKASFDSTRHADLMKLHNEIEEQIKNGTFVPVTTFAEDTELCPVR